MEQKDTPELCPLRPVCLDSLMAQVPGSTSCTWCVRQARANQQRRQLHHAPVLYPVPSSGVLFLSPGHIAVSPSVSPLFPPSLPLFLRSTGSAWFTSEFLRSETIVKCERCAVCNIFRPVLVLFVCRACINVFFFFLLQVFLLVLMFTTNLNLCHMITVFSFVYFLLKILSRHS